MDVVSLHRRTVGEWTSRVESVGPDQWGSATPCAGWDARALVNHVVGEDLWTVPLLEGRTIAEVGDGLDGDLVGDRPVEAAAEAAAAALAAVGSTDLGGALVHLSYGDEDAGEYLRQLAADHLIHAWDLARATGGSTQLDPELVAEVASWFADREGAYRAAGIIGDPPDGTFEHPQDRLLAAFGRQP